MPGKGKHTAKFDRCVEKVMGEGHDQSSAYAICTASFEKSGEPILLAAGEREEMRFVTLLGAADQVSTMMHEGREWLDMPVVMLVEGVIHPVNAPNPELVTAECFSASVAEWNGKPLMAGHPMRGREPLSVARNAELLKESFGYVHSPRLDGKRLCAVTRMDPSRMTSGHPAQILEAVRAVPPRPVEVSVGVFTAMGADEGTWTNGKRYKGNWKTMGPDHLALFADGRKGACSVEMGCGLPRVAMRVAGETLELEDDVEPKNLFQKVLSLFRSAMPRGWGDDEVKQELREALEVVEPLMRTGGGEIVRVKNDAVVYCLYPPSNYYDAPMAKMTYWQRDFTFNTETQKYEISPERAQVEPTTVYAPYRASQESPEVPEPTPTAPCACGNHAAAAAGDRTMTKEERIAALAANPHSPVKSLKMLAAAEDAELTDLETRAAAVKKTADDAVIKAAEDKKDADKKLADDKAAADLKAAEDGKAKSEPETEEQVLARMPGLNAIVTQHRAAEMAKKTALVTSIRAASQVFTEEQLKAKSVEELEQLSALAKVETPKVDFSFQGTPRAAASGSDLASFAPPDSYAEPKAVTH